MLKLVRRVVPSTTEYDGQKLFTRRTGQLLATPLFAVLILIETTDVVFAVDSIPAILAVSREPFIVFSSNAFAILGLRALYFCLAGMAGRFRYLNVGLGVILAFVGVKMLIVELVPLPDLGQPGRDRGRADRHDRGQPPGRPPRPTGGLPRPPTPAHGGPAAPGTSGQRRLRERR